MIWKLEWKWGKKTRSRLHLYNFGTSLLLQVCNTLFVTFHRTRHAHLSNESNYKSSKKKILRHVMVWEETLRKSPKNTFQSQEDKLKKNSKNIKFGQTCTASTERTPFSHAFRTSKMAAGVLRQISCHFTWLSRQINVRGNVTCLRNQVIIKSLPYQIHYIVF